MPRVGDEDVWAGSAWVGGGDGCEEGLQVRRGGDVNFVPGDEREGGARRVAAVEGLEFGDEVEDFGFVAGVS